MKTKNFPLRKLFLFAAIPFLSALFLVACSKDNTNNDGSGDQVYTTQGDATGAQQNPAVSTTGTARLAGTYNASNNKWEYSINWTSLSGAATLIEFHGPADAGVNGDILFSLEILAGGSTGARSETTTLTEEQESYLMNGKIYYTILTSAHLTGEVRGQIFKSFR